MPHTKKGKIGNRRRIFIQLSLHITLQRKIGRNIRNYVYFYRLKKGCNIKDIKAECKSNLLKKNVTGKEDISRFLSMLKRN